MAGLAFPLAGPLGGDPDPRNNITKLLVALCLGGVQPLEDALKQVLLQRTLELAVGFQLDAIGKIVGQPRNGQDDDTYRRFCRATIAAHRSRGTNEDVLKVLDLVVFDDDAHFKVTPQPHATVTVDIQDIAISADLALTILTFLRRTVSVGVRVILESSEAPPADWFRFDTGPGFDISFFKDARDNS